MRCLSGTEECRSRWSGVLVNNLSRVWEKQDGVATARALKRLWENSSKSIEMKRRALLLKEL
jgi:hypothetical protein